MLAGPRRAARGPRRSPSISWKPTATGPRTPGASSVSTNVPRERGARWRAPPRGAAPACTRCRAAAPRADLVHRHRAEVLGVERVQHVGVLQPREERLPVGIGEGLGLAEPFPHRAPLARREHDQPHVAALAGVDLVERARAHAHLAVARSWATGSTRSRTTSRWSGRPPRARGRSTCWPRPAVAPRSVAASRRWRGCRRCRSRSRRAGSAVALRQAGLEHHAADGFEHGVAGDPVAVGSGLPEVADRARSGAAGGAHQVREVEAERREVARRRTIRSARRRAAGRGALDAFGRRRSSVMPRLPRLRYAK